MKYLILGIVTKTVFSQQPTTVVIHLVKNRRHALFATWEVVQQSSWFQQEHSVRTAGPRSMEDIWFQMRATTGTENGAATCVWMRHRKWQLAERHTIKQRSTLLKSYVKRCPVHCTSMEES